MRLQLQNDEYIGVGEASIILRVSRPTVYQWLRDGELTTLTIAGRLLLRRDEVEALGAARRAK